MQYIADLHIHSKYSRATSRDLILPNIEKWCKIKGVDIIATGDFTHPAWFKDIREQLEPAEEGLYKLKPPYHVILNAVKDPEIASSRHGIPARLNDSRSGGLPPQMRGQNDTIAEGTDNFHPVKFLLSTEISLIYTKNDKCRRLHILIFAPSIEAVNKINVHLEKIGNIHSDGRPILGLDAEEFAKIVLDKSEKCMIIPAHAWTPWFAVFGSKSGFDSLEECFGSMAKHIYAIETGLSSDPPMNWRLSMLDNITLISNSDAHSPSNIAREANIFEFTRLSYDEIYSTLKNKDKNKFLQTIEFFPEEGKYHFDGHRECGISFSPEETKKHKGICPICKKPLTLGVDYRVESLADRASVPVIARSDLHAPACAGGQAGAGATRQSQCPALKPAGRFPNEPKSQDDSYKIPCASLVGLEKIIAEAKGVNGVKSKAVQNEYFNLIENFGPELKILMDVPMENFANKKIDDNIIEGIKRVRERRLHIKPGYDGVYGEIKIFEEGEIKKKQQAALI